MSDSKPTQHKTACTSHCAYYLFHLDYSSAYKLLDLLHNPWVLEMLLSSPGVLLEIDKHLWNKNHYRINTHVSLTQVCSKVDSHVPVA
jgi:hypothetical protein